MIGSQRVQRKPSAQMPLLFSGAQRQYQVRLLLADQVLRFEAQGRVIYLLLTKSSSSRMSQGFLGRIPLPKR